MEAIVLAWIRTEFLARNTHSTSNHDRCGNKTSRASRSHARDDHRLMIRKLKRLRLRLFTAAGRLVRGDRRIRLRLAATWPWAVQLTAAITRLQALAPG
jgi:Transposase DDE domain group 1